MLGYLLFEAHDEESYIENVRVAMDELFEDVNTTNLYFAKKNLRRILRITNKHIKYSGNKQTEATLLIHFCKLLNASGIPLEKSTLLQNLYNQQVKKIMVAIATLHEDLQYDMLKEVKRL